MGILSDLLTGPIGEVGYGAMAESYERANKKADDQAALFRDLGVDLRAERMTNEKLLNEKLSNFRSVELDFLSNAKKYGDYGDLSQEDLKLKFAPMANFLKGDTFVGKPEDVQKKVAEALYQSGGYKEGDPYTSVEEFTNQTKSAISKPLELYSGLAWNTWENQVGNLAYKTPEYDMDAAAAYGLRITAANFPQWFPATYGKDSPAMTVARLSIMAENARNDSIIDGVFDPNEFSKLKEDKFNEIKDSLNMGGALDLFGINESEFMKLVTSGSPSLSRLTQVTTQLATMSPTDPKYQELVNESAGLIRSHLNHLERVKENMISSYVTKDSTLTKPLAQLAHSIDVNDFGDEAYKIHTQRKKVLADKESVLGFHMPENFQAHIIPGNEGRLSETFAFVTVIQAPVERYGKEQTLNKKWVLASSSGVKFELPSIMTIKALIDADGDISKIRAPSDLPATIDDFNMPSRELKKYAALAIKYAMEGKLKLNFVRRDNSGAWVRDDTYVKALEQAGAFGKNNKSGYNIKYFGQEPVTGYGTGILLDTEIDIDTGI